MRKFMGGFKSAASWPAQLPVRLRFPFICNVPPSGTAAANSVNVGLKLSLGPIFWLPCLHHVVAASQVSQQSDTSVT